MTKVYLMLSIMDLIEIYEALIGYWSDIIV